MKTAFSRCLALVLAAALIFSFAAVPAHAEEIPVNLMRSPKELEEMDPHDGGELPFWGQLSIKRSWVHRIEFHDTKADAPANILDFSENNDKSVIGWYTPSELHLAADGKITLPEKSSWLFAYFTGLEEVRFNGAVDTSRTTSMDYMFFYCTALKTVDVSGFDTSRVTTMRNMFAYCEKVEALDVGGFTTDLVEDFSYMFFFCRKITELNLTNFRTPAAKYMMSMFYRCEHLKNLDYSGFDMSHVISSAYIDGYTNIW